MGNYEICVSQGRPPCPCPARTFRICAVPGNGPSVAHMIGEPAHFRNLFFQGEEGAVRRVYPFRVERPSSTQQVAMERNGNAARRGACSQDRQGPAGHSASPTAAGCKGWYFLPRSSSPPRSLACRSTRSRIILSALTESASRRGAVGWAIKRKRWG